MVSYSIESSKKSGLGERIDYVARRTKSFFGLWRGRGRGTAESSSQVQVTSLFLLLPIPANVFVFYGPRGRDQSQFPSAGDYCSPSAVDQTLP